MSDDVKKKRRWVPIMLTVSLILNVLVVGVVLGTALRFRDGGGEGPPIAFGQALYRALPGVERKELRRGLSEQYSKRSQQRSADFKALSQALRAVPFDPQPVEMLLQRQELSIVEMQESLGRKWLARVTNMTDEERADYADKLEKIVKKGHGRKYRNR